jgi:protease I
MKYSWVILVLVILLSGCTTTQTTQTDLNIEKTNIMEEKKILMIVAPENFRDEEFLEPKKVFESNGAEIIVASKEVQEAKGMFGTTAKIDIDIEDVNVDEYDAVIFVGGSGSSVYYKDQTALNIAKKAYEKNKVVGAICIAPGILANAGILNGKKATIWDSGDGTYKKILEDNGVQYTGNNVEQDGRIITANGPHAATQFGEKIIEILS